jgi:prepilin-type N-terminal cleavage/methylation domain-containing protein
MQALIPNVRSQSYPFEAAHCPQQKQQGYTIVELSIAVAIAGVLLVSAVGLVQTVLQTSRANDTATWLTRATAQIDKIWKDQNGYADLTLVSANAAGALKGVTVLVNATASPPTATVTSKFNRPIYLGLTPNLPTASANAGYVLTFAGVPTPVCADLVTAAASGGVRGIVITPETAASETSAAKTAASMTAAGVITLEGSVTAFDPSAPAVQLANMTGTSGCGTDKSTVALSFYGWK